MSTIDAMLEAYGAPMLEQGFGVQVRLQHGSQTTDEFTATWENKVYQVADSEGFLTSFESRDFTFAKADAAISSQAFEPRAGDLITLTENESGAVYELLPVGTALPAVELMPGGYRYLVHTKRVA